MGMQINTGDELLVETFVENISVLHPYTRIKKQLKRELLLLLKEHRLYELNQLKGQGERGGHDVFCRTIGEALLKRIDELK